MKKLKNLLVQYKGGGYDGCFWEWNYFMFDGRGKFHNLGSSGRKGITTRQGAIDLLAKKDDKRLFISTRKEFYKYSLTNKKQVREFIKESSEEHVLQVALRLNDIVPESKKIKITCPDCGDKIAVSKKIHDAYPQFLFTGYKGNGGVGIQHLGMVCTDCYGAKCCGYCGEYDDQLNDEGHCEHCAEKLNQENKE